MALADGSVGCVSGQTAEPEKVVASDAVADNMVPELKRWENTGEIESPAASAR